MTDTSDYVDYFLPELDMLDKTMKESEELYDEVHRGMQKNIERIDQKAMFGGSSPYKDISELGTVLNNIRGNQIQIIKERTNIKKTVKDLEIRRDNIKKNDDNNANAQIIVRDFLAEIQRQHPSYNKATQKEITNKTGIEKIQDLDPAELGINENDLKMIDKFRKGTGK